MYQNKRENIMQINFSIINEVTLSGQNTLPIHHLFSLGFTPRKAKQSVKDMELQEDEEDKDEQYLGKLVKKSQR